MEVSRTGSREVAWESVRAFAIVFLSLVGGIALALLSFSISAWACLAVALAELGGGVLLLRRGRSTPAHVLAGVVLVCALFALFVFALGARGTDSGGAPIETISVPG